MKRVVAAIMVAAGAACVNTTQPRGFVYQYQVGVFGCGADCTEPGTTAVASAARGDTVWLQHHITLLQSFDSSHTATVRPDCAENVSIRIGSALRDTVPTPTCPDSLASRSFTLGDTLTRFNQWIVDSALAPAVYTLVGRVLVQPRLEPTFGFDVQ